MAQAFVDVTVTVAKPADDCWAVLRDFCAPWHPAIRSMHAEDGGRVRVFTVQGEPTLYKEQITWLSDSDRSLRYTHLQGIDGAERYDAAVSVTPDGGAAARVRWQAEIEAPKDRAEDIAAGTEAVFRLGLDALSVAIPAPTPSLAVRNDRQLETRQLATQPAIALLTAGSGDGPLCLFLHGIGGQKENWSAQVQHAGTVTPAAAMDLRGYGGSALGSTQSTIDNYCADILAVCDALGTRRLVLCGLSYGAWIATSFALRHPERLAGLVLAGGCTGMSEAGPDERRAFRESREVPLAQGQTPADFAPAVVDIIAGPSANAETRGALTASMAAIPVQTYRDALRCFTNPPGQFDFRALSVPVLMMTGEHDRLAPPQEIRSVANRIWGAAPRTYVRFEQIADAGHVCNLEQPHAVNRILLEFLNMVRS